MGYCETTITTSMISELLCCTSCATVRCNSARPLFCVPKTPSTQMSLLLTQVNRQSMAALGQRKQLMIEA